MEIVMKKTFIVSLLLVCALGGFADADRALEKIAREFIAEIETLATDTGTQLRQEIESALEAKPGESLVIVGNKGAGKSTFIERFFKRLHDRTLADKC